MKNTIIFLCVITFFAKNSNAQNITELGPDNYRSIQVEWDGYSDYTKEIILLHEIYNGTLISSNYTIGTLTAKRGETTAGNRFSSVKINSTSAYSNTFANFQSTTFGSHWKLKTCTYNGKRYLAVEVPYSPACFNQGYFFTGYAKSTGLLLKCISYEINGQPVNQNILSNIQDYNEYGLSEKIQSDVLEITGKVGIGTTNLSDALNVNGTVHAKEVKVDLIGWSDFVFEKDYQLTTLQELKKYIQQNGHLPAIPNQAEVLKNGIELGEMNKKLLQKIEELTLHLIKKDDEVLNLEERMKRLEAKILERQH